MQTDARRTSFPGPDARILGDTLVASLPDAAQPVVWRLPLAQAKASAIEVQDSGGNFVLVLKPQDGETQDIASYAAKADAVRALTVIGQAMFGASVPASSQEFASAPIVAGQRKRRWRWLVVALAALLIAWLMLHGPRRVSDSAPAPRGDATAVTPGIPPGAPQTGVPQSADSFLQQQQAQ